MLRYLLNYYQITKTNFRLQANGGKAQDPPGQMTMAQARHSSGLLQTNMISVCWPTAQGGEPIWQDLCFGANPVRFGANPVRSDRICSQNGGHRQNYSHLQMIFGCKQTKWRGYFAICHCKGWHVVQVCLGEYPWIVYSFHLIDIAEKKLKTEMIWLDLLHPIWMRKQVI